ncbi:hypothetical protein BGZ58_010449 [Dissophora ornata]|nr:hypothetical protein BGZ58_010449 [Dissophora ornata]
MKSFITLTAALATTVLAVPLIEYGSDEPTYGLESSPIDKQTVGGLSTPSAFTSTLNSKTAPINYGNLNMGTGMMPSQVVHYGIEDHPDHEYISPVLLSTTAKEADFQLAKAEKAGHLINADVDVGKLNLAQLSKYADLQDEQDPAKWGWGMGGWGWRMRGPWGMRGWGWRRRRWF